MSDDAKEPENEPENKEGPVGGERLRAARRANDISVRDIAKELHLDEAKVRALEQNEFDVLGAPVFAKGHLRKYAELVGVAADDIMTDYYKMTRAAAAPPIVGPVTKRPRDINIVPWILGALIVVVVAAAAYWWLALRTPDSASTRTPAQRARPAVSDTVREVPVDETSAVDAAVTGDQPEAMTPPEPETGAPAPDSDAETADTAPVSVTEPEPRPQAAVAASAAGLRLSFSGDCWTEVSDATGERLFYDLGAAGRVVTLSGEPPFRLILGDADNVSITVNGQDYPIPESARRGRLARLTINPD